MNNLFCLAASPKSLVEELWDYFVEYYLEADAIYPNLGMNGTSMVSLPIILAGLFIGALVATLAAMHDSRVIGGYVRKMLSEGNVGKENATTLYHLGTNERSSFARALRKAVGLRRVVKCVEEEEYYEKIRAEREEYEKKREEDESLPALKEPSEYVHVDGEHFYIPEDKRITAEFKYIRRGVRLWVLPVIIVALVVGFFALMLLLPYMLGLLDALIGSFNSSNY